MASVSAIAHSGRSEVEWGEQSRSVRERTVESNPRIGQLIATRGPADIRAARDAKFRYRRERILDGLHARLCDADPGLG
ncbi:hypothetical protein ABIA39_006710 [Nocardia sp. GAS34]|uniref:hypothetical protein n=1 Tax=unclassified Nocardia TaxID=2637762 RepID=UPI003D1FCFE6